MAYSTPLMLRLALAPRDWTANPQPNPDAPTNTAADMSDSSLLDEIAEADAFIDSYIGGRYATPVLPSGDPAAVPHPIDYWSRNIAAYNATLTFRKGQDLDDNDPVVRRYTLTMIALTAVRDGKATLPIPPINGAPGAATGAGQPVNVYDGTLGLTDGLFIGGPSWPRPREMVRDGYWWSW